MDRAQMIEQMGMAVVSIMGAFLAMLVPFLPKLIPIYLAWTRDVTQRQAFDAVSRVGTMAVTEAARAQDQFVADNGGTPLTDEQRTSCLVSAWVYAWRTLGQQNRVAQILNVYGSEESVRAAVDQMVRHSLWREREALAVTGMTTVPAKLDA